MPGVLALQGQGKINKVVAMLGVAVLTKLLILFFLVPGQRIKGVMWAEAISSALYIAGILITQWKIFGGRPIPKLRAVYYLAIACLMFSGVEILRAAPLFLRISCGAVLYLIPVGVFEMIYRRRRLH